MKRLGRFLRSSVLGVLVCGSGSIAAPAEAQSRVLIDASRDGGAWWFPQEDPVDPNLPHQGQALAGYLRGLGMEVTELPRPFTITSDLLSKAHLVIAVSESDPYTSSELAAYSDFVSNGGRLILLADHKAVIDSDSLALSFGLDFSGAISGVVTTFAPHAITAGVSSLSYLAGSIVSTAPVTATILGSLAGDPVMGIMPFGLGKVFFLGDTNGIESVPQPFVSNRVNFMLGPACDIQMSDTSYVTGDVVTARVFRFTNPGPAAVAIELKIWLGLPESAPVSVTNVGSNGAVLLPAGFDQDFGPVPLFAVTPVVPPGSYELSCRILNPVTGALLAEDINPFAIR